REYHSDTHIHLLLTRLPPTSPLFPYTTLFRSFPRIRPRADHGDRGRPRRLRLGVPSRVDREEGPLGHRYRDVPVPPRPGFLLHPAPSSHAGFPLVGRHYVRIPSCA